MSLSRPDGRNATDLRPLTLALNPLTWAEGSCRVIQGGTELVCAASFDERVPPWLRGAGQGWVTAEYGMLPRSTSERMRREATGGQGGRTLEIQRLIGRALRGVHRLDAMGARTLRLDCDVINADGGTRCAAINGAYVACALAWQRLVRLGLMRASPLCEAVAAVSCVSWQGQVLLDPNYAEDSTASVDANFVFAESGGLIEVQMTGEGAPFAESLVREMLSLAQEGARAIFQAQKKRHQTSGSRSNRRSLNPWMNFYIIQKRASANC